MYQHYTGEGAFLKTVFFIERGPLLVAVFLVLTEPYCHIY